MRIFLLARLPSRLGDRGRYPLAQQGQPMDLVETQVRKLFQTPCVYQSQFDARNFDVIDLNSGTSSNFVQLMYGAIAVYYPFDSDPDQKLTELEVFFDGFIVEEWEANGMMVMNWIEEGSDDPMWSFSDVEEAVELFVGLIIDYIQLVYSETLDENQWRADS